MKEEKMEIKWNKKKMVSIVLAALIVLSVFAMALPAVAKGIRENKTNADWNKARI